MKAKKFLALLVLLCTSAVADGQSGKRPPVGTRPDATVEASQQITPPAQAESPSAPERQEKPPLGLRVVVNIFNGDPIKGSFVKADAKTVTIDMGAGQAVIQNDKIISIVFQPSLVPDEPKPIEAKETDAPTKSSQLVAAEKVVAALRRLDNATAVGVLFQNYSQMLIESKSIIDENISLIQDQAFKAGVFRAVEDYQYAMYVWNLAVANNWAVFYTKKEPGRTLVTRYGVPIKISIFTQVPVNTGLNHIWLSARNHFNSTTQRIKVLEELEKEPPSLKEQ